MARPLPNYLRTHRKRMGLTQAQVAYLLGSRSGTKVSRYERSSRLPDLRTALAFEAIYERPVRELFAGCYEVIESETDQRAHRLAERLTASPQPSARRAPSEEGGGPQP